MFTKQEWARIVYLAQMARQQTRSIGVPSGRLTPAAKRAGEILRRIARGAS